MMLPIELQNQYSVMCDIFVAKCSCKLRTASQSDHFESLTIGVCLFLKLLLRPFSHSSVHNPKLTTVLFHAGGFQGWRIRRWAPPAERLNPIITVIPPSPGQVLTPACPKKSLFQCDYLFHVVFIIQSRGSCCFYSKCLSKFCLYSCHRTTFLQYSYHCCGHK